MKMKEFLINICSIVVLILIVVGTYLVVEHDDKQTNNSYGKILIINNNEDCCVSVRYTHCGSFIDGCKSGNTYNCVTNLIDTNKGCLLK